MMGIMNKKQRMFVHCYTDRTCTLTFGNATQSAIKAGYSPRTAHVIGCRLLKIDKISVAISTIEKEEQARYDLTKEAAITEARQNHLEAKTDMMKKYWHDVYIKLKGWDISKIETKTKADYTLSPEKSKALQSQINRLFKKVSDN